MSKTAFTDGNPTLGQLGTVITAAFLTALQNHRHDGQDQDNSCPMDYAADTGAANAYVVALTPALTVHIVGLPIFFKAAAANTGASTININGLGAKAIKHADGTALQTGDIPAGAVCQVAYDGTNYQLLSGQAPTLTAFMRTLLDDADATTALATLGAAPAAAAIPPGTVIYCAMSSAPNGYLKANGALVSKTTYSALFSAIGTTFGVGDGSTTFALPDLRGEFMRGFDDGRGVDIGRVFGSSQTQLVQAHNHNAMLINTSTSGGSSNYYALSGSGVSSAGVIVDNVGSETRPRNIAMLACIKY